MKKFTLLMLFFVLQVNAQVSYYTFNNETGGSLTSSGTNLGYQGNYYASNSNATYTINLPFTFYFNGDPYTTISACTNGFIKMGADLLNGTEILNNQSATNIISALNTTLKAKARFDTGINDYVTEGTFGYNSTGSAPNRVFTVYWNKFTNHANAEDTNYSISFNIKLYESTNVIEFVYGDMTPLADVVQVGLKGESASDVYARKTTTNWFFTNFTHDPNATCILSNEIKPINGQIFRWTPPTVDCNRPFNIHALNITSTTAAIQWFNTGTNASNYEYVVQLAGGSVPTTAGTPLYNTIGVMITDLIPSTNYVIYIRQVCRYGIYSNYSAGRFDFRTSAAALSAEDFEMSKIKMYPNPVSNVLKLESENTINSANIYNLLGQLVVAKNINETDAVIDCSALTEGTYFVHIETPQGKIVKKFIKKN